MGDDDNSKIICSKNNIILRRSHDKSTHTMDFGIKNERIQLSRVINLNLYPLLYQLNRDVIERLDILSESDTESTILIVFKQFGREFGVSKKYICLHSTIETSDGAIVIKSKSVNTPKLTGILNCEEIVSPFTNLYATLNSEHEASMKFVTNVKMLEELPIYVENMLGIVMKQIFLRIKEFIEKL